MARQIFVVDAQSLEGSSEIRATLVFWFAAPTNRVPVPNASASPGIPPSTAVDATNGVSWGYTAAELAAVHAGTTIVQVASLTSGELTGPVNLTNFRNAAVSKYNAALAAITAAALGIKTIGMVWDGTSWTNAP